MSCATTGYAVFFLFFKQKTAYEMRISDWSSDVCSSDLAGEATQKIDLSAVRDRMNGVVDRAGTGLGKLDGQVREALGQLHTLFMDMSGKIGRASCRERECQYV